MFNTPILLVTFNRPDLTKLVFEVIKKVQPRKLYISSDGPRKNNSSDLKKITEVRSIFDEIDWHCEVNQLYQSGNLGCSFGPIEAFNWFFSFENEGIILEDDCLPHIDFFYYCQILLEKYRENNKILNICGSNMGFHYNLDSSYFYSRFMNMSGWATWKRSVILIDYDITNWKNTKNKKFNSYKLLRQSIFDLDIGWYQYWYDKFNKTINDKNISWWDWQWIYHQLKHRQLSIVPTKNLVTNIGFDEMATHTRDPSNPAANIPSESFRFPLIHPLKIAPNFKYEEHIKWVWCYYKRLPFMFYIKRYVSKVLGRII